MKLVDFLNEFSLRNIKLNAFILNKLDIWILDSNSPKKDMIIQ